MKDANGRIIKISTIGDLGPYIIVPVERMNEVKKALSQAGIPCIARKGAIKNNERPAVDILDLGKGADISKAQEVLDNLK